ncbi:unnamed protein product, partial [Discosporangium mesarthrocarpum]
EEELDTTRCPYANILGKLMFFAGVTRPDLPNSVRELGRRAGSPCLVHWRGLQHVLPYLVGTKNIGLHYPGELNNNHKHLLAGYADQTGPTTRKYAGASPDTSNCSTDRPSSDGRSFKGSSPSPGQRPSGRPWPTECATVSFSGASSLRWAFPKLPRYGTGTTVGRRSLTLTAEPSMWSSSLCIRENILSAAPSTSNLCLRPSNWQTTS